MRRADALTIARQVQESAVEFDYDYLTSRIADELMKAAAPHECQWRLMGWETDGYDTSCGHAWQFSAETLEHEIKAGVIYCPYCAGRIVPTEAEWQVAERVEREAEEA